MAEPEADSIEMKIMPRPDADPVPVGGIDDVWLLGGAPRRAGALGGMSIPVSLLPLGDGTTSAGRITSGLLGDDPVCGRPMGRLLVPKLTSACSALIAEAGVQLEPSADPAEYRGTAGVLRDHLPDRMSPEDRIFVVYSTEVFCPGALKSLALEMASCQADVVLARDTQNRPIGVMLVGVRCLERVPRVGYVDFREQLLPELARELEVRVVTSRDAVHEPPVPWLYDKETYLRAVESRRSPLPTSGWEPLIGGEAAIGSGAEVQSSVVLGRAKIGKDAVVARSVIDNGAVVGAGEVVVDEVRVGSEAP